MLFAACSVPPTDYVLPLSEKDGALIPGIAMPADGNTAAHST
jgi:hypothetical protein